MGATNPISSNSLSDISNFDNDANKLEPQEQSSNFIDMSLTSPQAVSFRGPALLSSDASRWTTPLTASVHTENKDSDIVKKKYEEYKRAVKELESLIDSYGNNKKLNEQQLGKLKQAVELVNKQTKELNQTVKDHGGSGTSLDYNKGDVAEQSEILKDITYNKLPKISSESQNVYNTTFSSFVLLHQNAVPAMNEVSEITGANELVPEGPTSDELLENAVEDFTSHPYAKSIADGFEKLPIQEEKLPIQEEKPEEYTGSTLQASDGKGKPIYGLSDLLTKEQKKGIAKQADKELDNYLPAMTFEVLSALVPYSYLKDLPEIVQKLNSRDPAVREEGFKKLSIIVADEATGKATGKAVGKPVGKPIIGPISTVAKAIKDLSDIEAFKNKIIEKETADLAHAQLKMASIPDQKEYFDNKKDEYLKSRGDTFAIDPLAYTDPKTKKTYRMTWSPEEKKIVLMPYDANLPPIEKSEKPAPEMPASKPANQGTEVKPPDDVIIKPDGADKDKGNSEPPPENAPKNNQDPAKEKQIAQDMGEALKKKNPINASDPSVSPATKTEEPKSVQDNKESNPSHIAKIDLVLEASEDGKTFLVKNSQDQNTAGEAVQKLINNNKNIIIIPGLTAQPGEIINKTLETDIANIYTADNNVIVDGDTKIDGVKDGAITSEKENLQKEINRIEKEKEAKRKAEEEKKRKEAEEAEKKRSAKGDSKSNPSGADDDPSDPDDNSDPAGIQGEDDKPTNPPPPPEDTPPEDTLPECLPGDDFCFA